MNLARFARVTSATVVAGVAAIASYSHTRDLARANGQGDLLANLLPVSVDGMLIVASAVMSDDRAAGRPVRMSARISFVVGVAASIIANVLAAPPSTTARVISAWPALALLLVVEMLTGGRSAPATTGETLVVAEPAGEGEPTAQDQPMVVAEPAYVEEVFMIEPANGEVSADTGEVVNEGQAHEVEAPEPAAFDPASSADLRELARELYRASVGEGEPLSGAELARRFGKSPRWGVDRVNEVRRETGKVNGEAPALFG